MRVLLITWEFPPYVVGGIGTHVAQLAPYLGGVHHEESGDQPDSDRGMTALGAEPIYVDVVTTRFGGGEAVEQYSDYVTIHRVDVPPMDALDLYNSVVDNNYLFVEYTLRLAQESGRETPFDVIHVHDWLTAEAGIRLKHHWKTPLLVTIHATERGRHQGFLPSSTSAQIDHLEWRVCFESWTVVACSDYMRGELVRSFSLPAEKIVVIPNGVNMRPPGHCDEKQLAEMSERFTPNGERLIFFVGRIVHEKGVQYLVRAMPRILAIYPNTRLLIAGRNSQKLYPLAFELGVEKNVEFLGYISDEERDCLYAIVDVAIFPSLYEPFGIVALEAMASGCNVIASDTGGLGEVVQHEVSGLTTYPGDPLSIAWAVERHFSDSEAAAKRCAAALDQVNNVYRWDLIGERTAQLYADVHRERLADTGW